MPDSSRNRLIPRAGVLLVALLQLAGLGLAAPLHADGFGEPNTALVEDDGSEPGAPRPHDASDCATCQLGTSSALPGLPDTRLPRVETGSTTGSECPVPVLPAPPLRTTARAPPAA